MIDRMIRNRGRMLVSREIDQDCLQQRQETSTNRTCHEKSEVIPASWASLVILVLVTVDISIQQLLLKRSITDPDVCVN